MKICRIYEKSYKVSILHLPYIVKIYFYIETIKDYLYFKCMYWEEKERGKERSIQERTGNPQRNLCENKVLNANIIQF